jgi:hypothetical protein
LLFLELRTRNFVSAKSLFGDAKPVRVKLIDIFAARGMHPTGRSVQ